MSQTTAYDVDDSEIGELRRAAAAFRAKALRLKAKGWYGAAKWWDETADIKEAIANDMARSIKDAARRCHKTADENGEPS